MPCMTPMDGPCPDAPCLTPMDKSCPIDASSVRYSVYVYSNDGSELLWEYPFWDGYEPIIKTPLHVAYNYYENVPSIYVNYDGYIVDVFNMSGYRGLSYYPNQTTGGIEIGVTLASVSGMGTHIFINPATDVSVYVVGGSPTPTGSTIDVTYNSTKIIDSLEVTPPVAVTYNGSTIATLNEGDTKTLQCNGKVMASNVVIGEKTSNATAN